MHTYCTSMFWSIDSCQNRVPADQYHLTVSRFDFSHRGHALVTLYVQFLCSDWSKFDRWVHAENLCSILNLVYFDSWSWQSFVSTGDVFNCLFPLNVQNEIQLLSRVFCCSWLVCLLGLRLRNTSLVKVGNPISDGIVFVFHLAWCSLKFIRLLRVVLSSQQRLNQPVVNAVQWRHSLPENRVVILIGWLSKHSHNYV